MPETRTAVHCVALNIGVPEVWDAGFTAIVAYRSLCRVRDCWGRRGAVKTVVHPSEKFSLTLNVKNLPPLELQRFITSLTHGLRVLEVYSNEAYGDVLPKFLLPALIVNKRHYDMQGT